MVHSKNAIKISASAYLVVSTAIIIFGRNVPSIWQGMVGIIASLEGIYGAESGNPRRVMFFLILLLPLIVVSLTFGILVLSGKGSSLLVNCNSQIASEQFLNTTTTEVIINCGTSYVVFGFVELCGGGGVGFVSLIVVFFALRKFRIEAAENNAKQADMENLFVEERVSPII